MPAYPHSLSQSSTRNFAARTLSDLTRRWFDWGLEPHDVRQLCGLHGPSRCGAWRTRKWTDCFGPCTPPGDAEFGGSQSQPFVDRRLSTPILRNGRVVSRWFAQRSDQEPQERSTATPPRPPEEFLGSERAERRYLHPQIHLGVLGGVAVLSSLEEPVVFMESTH